MNKTGTLILVVLFLLSGCNSPSGNQESEAASTPISVQIQPTIPPEPTIENTSTEIPPTEKPPDPTETAVPEIVHVMWPGSPLGNINQTVHDQVDDKTAPQKQAFGGDDFKNGKYERPFDTDMNYMPFADLVTIQLNRADPLWIYVTFKVNGPLTDEKTQNLHFLVEIDKDLDSRGDILVVSGLPKSTEWSTDSVMVLSNPDINVGGTLVVRPDPNLTEGRGYYEELFNNGKGDDPDLAMSRLSETDPSIVLVAFKNTLTGGEKGKFIWLPWTDIGMLDWSLFDFNDHFTFEQAGYPVKDDMKNYPLKAIWGVDNTCRIPSGFTPNGTMPGLCPNYDPPPSKGRSGGPNCHWTCWGTVAMVCGCK